MSLLQLRILFLPGPLLGCFLLIGCASTPSEVSERHMERATAELRQRSDADSLAAAALFGMTERRSQSLVLLARAEASAPERPDLVWLHIQMCRDDPSCDPKPEELKLRALSPDNGAGWLGELTRAVAAHNDVARDAALMAIGHTGHVNIYWTTLVAHLSDAAARTRQMSPPESMIAVSGVLAAVAIPIYGPTAKTCKGDGLQRGHMLEACRGVASALEHGDTAITEMMGVAIAKRVWPEGSDEWNLANERRRVFDYRSALWRPFEPVTWTIPQAQKYLAYCFAQVREQDVMRAQLLDAGKDPDPPAT